MFTTWIALVVALPTPTVAVPSAPRAAAAPEAGTHVDALARLRFAFVALRLSLRLDEINGGGLTSRPSAGAVYARTDVALAHFSAVNQGEWQSPARRAALAVLGRDVDELERLAVVIRKEAAGVRPRSTAAAMREIATQIDDVRPAFDALRPFE